MRRFKLQVQTSIDGFMAVPEGEPGWTSVPLSEDVYAYMYALMESVDCIVLGRKIADEFITAWASRLEDEPEELVDWINHTHKVVISNTLTTSSWENVDLAGGDLAETVNRLKTQPGGDLIAYGGVTLVSSLIAHDLLDDVYLFVNPVAIGSGRPVFGDLATHRRFHLADAQPFACGVVALHYQRHAS